MITWVLCNCILFNIQPFLDEYRKVTKIYLKSICVSHIMVAVVSCYLSNGWAAIFLSSWLCNWVVSGMNSILREVVMPADLRLVPVVVYVYFPRCCFVFIYSCFKVITRLQLTLCAKNTFKCVSHVNISQAITMHH